jgi:hypothetical protein
MYECVDQWGAARVAGSRLRFDDVSSAMVGTGRGAHRYRAGEEDAPGAARDAGNRIDRSNLSQVNAARSMPRESARRLEEIDPPWTER